MSTTHKEAPFSLSELDKKFAHYKQLEAAAEAAEEARAAAERELVPLVKAFGDKGEKAAQSFLLRSTRHEALATFGFTRNTRQDAVRALLQYMRDQKLLRFFRRMYEAKLTFTMVDGAAQVLADAKIDDRTHKTCIGLFGACLTVTPQKPKLKVKELVAAPAKKTHGGKAAK